MSHWWNWIGGGRCHARDLTRDHIGLLVSFVVVSFVADADKPDWRVEGVLNAVTWDEDYRDRNLVKVTIGCPDGSDYTWAIDAGTAISLGGGAS